MSKKKQQEEPIPLLGRPGNHVKMGIVGLPNVGKSTLFNILTKLSVPAENYPFCTIDPNEARVAVPDVRYNWLVKHWEPASEVSAFLQITDIAGLVKGASTGEGLGNNFLSHIRAVDGIFHVIRIFDSEEITHVDGSLDPIRDVETIEEELRLKDVETVTKALEALEKEVARARKDDRTKRDELDTVKKIMTTLNQKVPIRFETWGVKEIDIVNDLMLLTAKPVIYLINMSERDFVKQRNKWLPKIAEWVKNRKIQETVIPFSGAFENRLLTMTEQQKEKLRAERKMTTAIPKIIRVGYSALQLIHFFTCGKDEVKCWTVRKGTKAPQAAGTIHTDFLNGFVCAEVMKYTDFKELKSDNAVKAAGKYYQEGKNYVVEDGDIIFFKVNAGAGLSAGKKGKK